MAVEKKKSGKKQKKIPQTEKEVALFMAKKALLKGVLPKEQLGINDRLLEYLYHFATKFYTNGQYKQGVNLFQVLFTLDPTQARFYTGLGCCQMQLKEHQEAISAFLMASELDRVDPLPFFYMSECLLTLNAPIEAAIALQSVISRCGDNPLFEILKNKATLMIETLKPVLPVNAPAPQ